MLILISGCSGSGKNTIIRALIEKNENISFLKSCTTRKKRPNEPADTYIYLSRDDFDDRIKKGEMFEHEEIHQNFYGLLQSSLDAVVDGDKLKKHYIKDIGVLGQINLTRALENKTPVLSIFLSVPRKTLVKRLAERGEKDIDLRLSRMEFEEGYTSNYDAVIKNTDFEKTMIRIEKLIAKKQKESKSNKLGGKKL